LVRGLHGGLHTEVAETKAFRTFIRIYSLFKNECLRGTDEISNDLSLHHLGISGRHLSLKIAVPTKQVSQYHWKFPRYTPVRDLHMALHLPYVCNYITKLCRQQSHTKS
jgi:hypothetical protein